MEVLKWFVEYLNVISEMLLNQTDIMNYNETPEFVLQLFLLYVIVRHEDNSFCRIL